MTPEPTRTRRPHGALKHAVVDLLVASDRPLSAREIADHLADRDRPPSLTTVFTVLDRLCRSGEVRRDTVASGSYVFGAVRRDPGESATQMLETLMRSEDRSGALVSFAGSLVDEDLHVLRQAVEAAERKAR